MDNTPKPLPTQQRLHEYFDYSVITGELYHRFYVGNKPAGSVAGAVRRKGRAKAVGYRSVYVDGQPYRAARIVWRWVTGEDPGDYHVDHIDTERDNQAWHNLRLLTLAENNRNKRVHCAS